MNKINKNDERGKRRMKKSEFPKRCRSCRFFVKIYNSEYICDYNSQKNQLRACPISEECTCYQPNRLNKPKFNGVDPFKEV